MSDGAMITGTNYEHGEEVGPPGTLLRCPWRCKMPEGFGLVRVVEPGTPWGHRCPRDCGLAFRFVAAVSS